MDRLYANDPATRRSGVATTDSGEAAVVAGLVSAMGPWALTPESPVIVMDGEATPGEADGEDRSMAVLLQHLPACPQLCASMRTLRTTLTVRGSGFVGRRWGGFMTVHGGGEILSP